MRVYYQYLLGMEVLTCEDFCKIEHDNGADDSNNKATKVKSINFTFAKKVTNRTTNNRTHNTQNTSPYQTNIIRAWH